jgi:hypothetical protein
MLSHPGGVTIGSQSASLAAVHEAGQQPSLAAEHCVISVRPQTFGVPEQVGS